MKIINHQAGMDQKYDQAQEGAEYWDLEEQEAGAKISDVCGKRGISGGTYYWIIR